jgi:membrane-associated phospholipid phosphatase
VPRVEDERRAHRPKKLLSFFLGRIESRRSAYLLPPLAYFAAFVMYYALYGRLFQFIPGLLFLLAIPIITVLGRGRGMVKYWMTFVMVILSYEALAGTVGALFASRGVFSLSRLDELLWGFNVSGSLQSALNSTALTEVSTILYSLHVPLVFVSSILLWYFNRLTFGKYATAISLTSFSALATFMLVPTSPPWYDGVAINLLQSSSLPALQGLVAPLNSLIQSDKFAAFPSLHAAYAFVFLYFILKIRRGLGLVALPITIGILFSTLYLGQHYLIDLIGGAVYALVPCLISERVQIFAEQSPEQGLRTNPFFLVRRRRSVTQG